MVTWVVQKTSDLEATAFNENLKKALDGTRHTVEEIFIVPFEHSVRGGDPVIEGPVVAYGTTAIDKIVARNNWNPGVWRSEGFKEAHVAKALGDLYGNHDVSIMSVHDVAERAADRDMEFFFLKPNTDSKEFAGMVTDAKRFPSWMKNMMSAEWIPADFEVCMSSVKEWGMEWRLPVVNGEVVDYSVYMQWRTVMPERIINDDVLDVAYRAISLHNPAPVYTIDIGQIDGQYKVIEYNGFNSAGMYACDMKNVAGAINAYVEA